MPMHACAIVLEAVLDSNNNSVSPVGFDGRSGKLAVDSIDRSRDTIRGERQFFHLEVVSNSSAGVWPSGLGVAVDVVATSPACPIGRRVDAVGWKRSWWPWSSKVWVIRDAQQLCCPWNRSSINKLNE